MPKHITDITTDEITEIGKRATLEAREKALATEKNVLSKNDKGNLISEKMNKDGTIKCKHVQESAEK